MATSNIPLNSFRSMFTVTQEVLTHSVPKSSYQELSDTISNTGWYPIGVVGWNVAGSSVPSYQRIYRYTITNRASGSGTLSLYLYNSNANNVSAGTVTVYVLWQKVA